MCRSISNSTPSSTEGALVVKKKHGTLGILYVRDILKIDAGGRLIVIIHCYWALLKTSLN